MSCIVITEYGDNRPTNRLEVIQAWYQNLTFSIPHKRKECINREEFEKNGNNIDSVTYVTGKLVVILVNQTT